MTAARDVFGPQLPSPLVKANWLGRYLSVEHKFDKELFGMLKEAEKSVVQELDKIKDKENIGSQVRALQYKLARKTIRDYVNDLFGDRFGKMVRGYQADAAEEAINASLYDQKGLLAKLFKNPIDRQNYADSLRQTARQNVEAAISRILFTQQPLSERVYKTKALANGLVDKAINNGLARGDSANDIANAVRNLISPETAGGVSYAAKRLGRTEIHNAFHAQSILETQDTPWVADMQWHLSKRHKRDPGDLCESYALKKIFEKENVPMPPHPNCRCFVTPVLPDYNSFEDNLVAGRYNNYLDEFIGGTYQTVPKTSPPIEGVVQRKRSFERIEFEDCKTPEEVGKALQQRYPNIIFMNFNKSNTTIEAAKGYARGLDEMMKKYPNHKLDTVMVGVGPDWEYACTKTIPSTGSSLVIFNRRFAMDKTLTIKHMADDVDTFYHMSGAERNPYYYMAIHEYGHVLDASIRMSASENSVDILRREFLGQPGEIPHDLLPDFVGWLKKYIDGYGWDHGSGWPGYNAPEVIAEAFADFELNGKKALPTSEPLHMLLLFLTKHLH